MSILTLNLNSINLDDTNCDEVNSETAIHIKLLTWHNTFCVLKNTKHLQMI